MYLLSYRKMERDRILDRYNELHLYALHLVFIPVIQLYLDEFATTWNMHGIRTVKGALSPERMFIRGLTALERVGRKHNYEFTELKQVLKLVAQ